jgi:hypothetical protein
MRRKVEQALSAAIDAQLVRGLLDAYFELKEHYYLGRHRPSELEGGRFCEVAIRCVQQLGNGTFTPLSKKLRRFDDEVKAMENAGGGQAHESIRIHISRSLLAIYGVRNRRDVGHVGGDVNANLADATLVMTVCDWVLAELIRLTYGCPLGEAQALVDGLVERKIPLVQDFDGFPKVLDPKLSVGDKIMVVLYAKGTEGAMSREIKAWLRPVTARNVASALSRLEHARAYLHRADGRYRITRTGTLYVEERLLTFAG